jgi:hypothetical protein
MSARGLGLAAIRILFAWLLLGCGPAYSCPANQQMRDHLT